MIKRNLESIILIILWIFSIYSIVVALINPYLLNVQTFIGYGILLLITILKVLKIKRFKTLFGLFLMAGALNLIQFTYFTSTFFFRINLSEENNAAIGIQSLSFLLLLVFVAFNFSRILEKWHNHFSETPQEFAERQSKAINKYSEELKTLDNIKLEEIIENREGYIVEYVLAAQKMLKERKTNDN